MCLKRTLEFALNYKFSDLKVVFHLWWKSNVFRNLLMNVYLRCTLDSNERKSWIKHLMSLIIWSSTRKNSTWAFLPLPLYLPLGFVIFFYPLSYLSEIEFELFYLNREDHLINTITDYPKVLFRLNQESMSIFMTFFRKSKNAEHVRRLLSAEGIVYN